MKTLPATLTASESTESIDQRFKWARALPWRRFRSALWWPRIVPLLLFGVLCTAAFLLLPDQEHSVHLLIQGAELLAALCGVGACLLAARRLSAGKASTESTPISAAQMAWLLVAAALGCFAAGVLLHLALDVAHAAISRFPSPADLFWLLQPLLLTAGLLKLAQERLVETERSRDARRVLIDTVIVALAALVLTWITLIEPLLLSAKLPLLSRLLLIYYPLADVALLFSAVLLFFAGRGSLQHSRASGLMLLGVCTLVATNSVYLFWVMHRYLPATGFATGTALDIGWIWGCLFISASALAYSVLEKRLTSRASLGPDEAHAYMVEEPGVLPSDEDERHERRWQQIVIIWLPYVAALGVALWLIGREYSSGKTDSVQRMLPTISLLLLVVARQMLTLWDNTRLAERLREVNTSLEQVNTDLEQSVQERTQHLSTLHGITSTLNTSLDRRTVLRVALERTVEATGAGGGGIWLRVAENEGPPNPDADPNDPPRNMIWQLAHAVGFENNEKLQGILRDLAVAAAEDQRTPVLLSPAARMAKEYGFIPSSDNLVLTPIRWGGAVLGAFGLLRHKGAFTDEDRNLVESVALETGTALQNARLYQEARHRADRDSVTGLLNHRAMQERLNALLNMSRRHRIELSVVMMDLNNFKFFNDTYGHPVGDEVLRTVARHLREVCRENDIVGRYGGDEFIVLLPDTGHEGAREFCQRVAARLGEQHFQTDTGSRIPIEMAFGWAIYPRDADSALELLTIADAHLYEYKNTGGFQSRAHGEAGEQARIETRKLKNRAAGGSFGVLDALVTAIDNKDHYTRRHSEEVTHYSLLVAKELGYSEEALRAVRISGLLHDVGKIAVPDEILRKPGQLGADDWEIMKQHPVFGALIVKDLPHLEEVLNGVRHHHERWDGRGYPDALKENAIPTMGRLLAPADCFSAMTTNRPYRKALTPEEALREIEKGSGIQFDPAIAKVFIRVMRRELAGVANPQDVVPTISHEEMREDIVNEGFTSSYAKDGTAVEGSTSATRVAVS